MNSHPNIKAMAKNPNRQSTNDASTGRHITLTRSQLKSVFPNFILIKNKGESPPGCSRSSGSSLWMHPNINRTACNGNRINIKEEIKYNKSKANFIF